MRNKIMAGLFGLLIVLGLGAAPAAATEDGKGGRIVGMSGAAAAGSLRWAITPTGERVLIGATKTAGSFKGTPSHVAKLAPHDGRTAKLLTGSYIYAGGSQTPATPSDGAQAWLHVPNVGTPAAGDHSLMEVVAQHLISGANDDMVGAGFNVNVALYGNATPRVFVESYENGAWQGYNGGNGWTDLTDTCNGGGNMVAGTTTVTAGSVHTQVGWLYGGTPSGWYAYVDGCAFGYYPTGSWSPTFTAADHVQGYGEVYDSAGAGTTTTGMGLNVLPVASPAAGATVSSFALGTQPVGNVNLTWFTNSPNTSKWNVAGQSLRSGRVGGPGY